jgi:hypothetical protein
MIRVKIEILTLHSPPEMRERDIFAKSQEFLIEIP